MNDEHQNMDESYCQELMGVAALGHLNAEESAAFDGYLARNEAARTEFSELLSVVGLLPLALTEVSPSSDLRNRIASAIAAASERPNRETYESGGSITELPISRVPGKISWLASRTGKMLASAAAVLLIAVTAVTIAITTGDTDSENIDFALIPDGVSGTLEYQPDEQKFVFKVNDMPAAPANMVYQVWMIDTNDYPEPIGVMHGTEFVFESDIAESAAFAITVEPGPIGSAAPTSDPIVVAPIVQ